MGSNAQITGMMGYSFKTIAFTFGGPAGDCDIIGSPVNESVPVSASVVNRSTRSFVGGLRRFALAGLFGLASLSACGGDNPVNGGNGEDPDPVPVNSPMSVVVDVPSSYHFDEPVEHSFVAVDSDTIRDGYVRYFEDGEEVFSESLKGHNDVRVEVVWTPSPGGPGTGRVEYEVVDGFVGGPEVERGSASVEILDSRFFSGSFGVEDFFSGEGLEGYLTFPGHRSVAVSGGVASVSRSVGVDADSLFSGKYRVLGEFEGYPDHSSYLSGDEEGSVGVVRVVPYSRGDWDYDSYRDLLLHPASHSTYGVEAFAEGSMVTHRWPRGVELTNLLYDESYFYSPDDSRGSWVKAASADSDSLATAGFLADVDEATADVLGWIPEREDIQVSTFYESAGEVEFPRLLAFDTKTHYIFNGGEVDALYPLTRRGMPRDWVYVNASLSQRTPPAFESAPGATKRDVIENFGVRTSGHGALLAVGGEWTSLAPLAAELWYSRPPGSGVVELAGEGLPNASGGYTTSVGDWVGSWEKNSTYLTNPWLKRIK